jgi:hypothetical protein
MGVAPSMALAGGEQTVLTKVAALGIRFIAVVYSNAAHIENNRKKGDERGG